MKRLLALSLLLFLWMGALPGAALAQSGKLSGTVTDAGSGATMPGVTVVLEGTTLGAATDTQGRYTIIGVSPGAYSVRFSFVGYASQVIDNVRITSDRTKTLDASLREEAIVGEELVVNAERLVVDKNQTTSRSLVTGEELAALPVADLDEAISRTSNSYDGFIRGSRRYETKTLVDGVDVSDSFNNGSINFTPGGTYGGSKYATYNRSEEKSSGLFSLNPEAIEEVTVNSGATSASYASASGGVVAVTLSEGRGPLRGSFSARVAPQINRPGPDSLDFYYDSADYFADRASLIASGTELNVAKAALYNWTEDKYTVGGKPEMDFRGSLQGSISDKWGFALSGQYFQTNGFMPNYSRKKITGQLKTTYDISNQTQLSLVGLFEDNGLWGGWNNTDYSENFRFYLEGLAQRDGGSYMGSIKLRQIFNEKSFLTVQGYRTFDQNRVGYADDNGNGFQEIGENGDFIDLRESDAIGLYINNAVSRPYSDPKMFGISCDGTPYAVNNLSPGFTGGVYRLASCNPYQEDVKSVTNGVKADYTNQISFNHLLQLGADLKLRKFDYLQIDGSAGLGFLINDDTEPYILREYDRSPTEMAFYASDRMEYADLIVNVGLRLEVIDRDMEKIEDFFYPFEEVTESYYGRDVLRRPFVRGEKVDTDVFLNPSIGVSHPIGTNAAMYFSYSRSSQLMPYAQLYKFYDGNNSADRFNSYIDPEIDPIVSDNFELGVQWEISDGWGTDVNVYTRSIDNYGFAGFTAFARTPEGQTALEGFTEHSWITDFGYADSRGIEVVLRRAPRTISKDVRFGLTASYTYSTIEQSRQSGVNLNQFTSTGDADTTIPFDTAEDFQNFPINVQGGSSLTGGYDRLHRFILRGVGNLPAGINVGLFGSMESGFRYPPAVGADPRDRELLTGPTNYTIDLRLEKAFALGNRAGLNVYVDFKNLTDKQNVIGYETFGSFPALFQATGAPGPRLQTSDGSLLYGPARSIFFGTRLTF